MNTGNNRRILMNSANSFQMAESIGVPAAELPKTAVEIHWEIKKLQKEIGEYNVRITESRKECREAEQDDNPGRMLQEHLKYRTAWAIMHKKEIDMYDRLLDYFDKTHSLENASVTSVSETLSTKLTMIRNQINLGLAGQNHCHTMKMPLLVEYHDERHARLLSAKNEAAAKLRSLNMN